MTGNRDILLGIDLGTGGCKVTAISVAGTVLGDASTEYATHHQHPGWSEQEAGDWLPALCDSLGKLRAKGIDLERVAALALDGSTHNAVLLGEDMEPLRRVIMWTDQRSTAESQWLKEQMGDRVFTSTCQVPAPTWTLPQLMWLKNHEPDVLARTKHLLFVKDYVRYQLTGIAATDTIEAEGTLFFSMERQAWDQELFSLTGLRPDVLPELVSPTARLGSVTAAAARLTGLPAGTPVICGTSDSAVEDYGAGAIQPGDCVIKLATAGNVNVMTDSPRPHRAALTYSHVIPGMWYTVTATNAAALCQRWLRDLLLPGAGTEAFGEMNRLAASSPIGSNGVIFHPYLQGERSPYWDSALRGSFTGLSIASSRGDLLRAVLEGVAFSLLDCCSVIHSLQLPVQRIFLIGGGARSALWSSIVCDVFNVPVTIARPGDASFGTALLAGTGIGVFADAREAVCRCVPQGEPLMPDSIRAQAYQGLFSRYRQIHDALAPIYRQSSNL